MLQKGVSISASDETSIDVGVLSFNGYTPATQQALTQYNVHSVNLLPLSAFLPGSFCVKEKLSPDLLPWCTSMLPLLHDSTCHDSLVIKCASLQFSQKHMLRLPCPLQYLGTQRAQLRKLVKPTGKLLWMSEYGCGSSPPSNMGAALELSAMVLRVRTAAAAMTSLKYPDAQHNDLAADPSLIQTTCPELLAES